MQTCRPRPRAPSNPATPGHDMAPQQQPPGPGSAPQPPWLAPAPFGPGPARVSGSGATHHPGWPVAGPPPGTGMRPPPLFQPSSWGAGGVPVGSGSTPNQPGGGSTQPDSRKRSRQASASGVAWQDAGGGNSGGQESLDDMLMTDADAGDDGSDWDPYTSPDVLHAFEQSPALLQWVIGACGDGLGWMGGLGGGCIAWNLGNPKVYACPCTSNNAAMHAYRGICQRPGPCTTPCSASVPLTTSQSVAHACVVPPPPC